MENSGNISDSIIQSTDSATKSVSSTGTSLLDKIKGFNLITWIIIILILAILGFNVFTYLAAGTQDISQVLTTILTKILDVIPFTLNKIESGVTSAAQNISQSSQQNSPQETTSKTSIGASSVETSTTPTQVNTNNEQLNNVLNNSLNMQQQQQQQQDYQPYEAPSSITGGGKGETGQSGWCYIGEDRNVRTCAKVGQDDTCMSGDIFPSQEICMYPQLRP